MTKRTLLFSSMLCLVFFLLYVVPAKADVAPPQLPPGANLQPGESEVRTMVRMASENVTIVIEEAATPLEGMEDFTSSDMRARVEAEFTMHNDGDEDEAFEVWFPLGGNETYEGVIKLEEFHAWVNGQEAKISPKEIPGRIADEKFPWAAWRAKFPAGEDVNIRVSYFMRPTGYRPFGSYTYILETGAGWHGKIGEGTITLRLPYPVDKFNTALNPDTDGSPNPGGYQVSGTDVIWHFEELEPSASDNIHLTILDPHNWKDIQQARAEVERDPSSSSAELTLAEALGAALQYKYGLLKIGDSETVAEKADEAYRRAIELDPQNGLAYKAYALFLEKQSLYWMGNKDDPALEKLLPILAQALELNPADADLEETRQGIEGEGITIPTALPIPTANPTAETIIEHITPSPESNQAPPQSPPEEKNTPVGHTAPSPTPQAKNNRISLCPCGLAAALAPLGVWFFTKKRSNHRSRVNQSAQK